MKRVQQYFHEVIQELKKVSWPNRKQTIAMTLLVVGVTLFAGLYIGGLDLLFQRLMGIVIQ